MVKLFPHQQAAIERLRSGSILCGGVGTGKSLTALVYYLSKECGVVGYGQKVPNPKDLYIITTARKRDTLEWEGEYTKLLLGEAAGYYPMAIKVDSWNNIAKYTSVKDAFFIFDEQRVIGSGAWVKAFWKITKSNRWILLTATPGDTWMDYMPVFVANGFYRNKTDFVDQHVIYSRFRNYSKIDKYINCGRLVKQRRDILVTMTYQKKAVQHHEDVFTEWDKQLTIKTASARWNPFKDQPIMNASELCYTLRRIANSDPSRLTSLLDIYDKRHKLIVFYNFDYELDEIRQFAEGLDIPYAEWNGWKHEKLPDGDHWLYLVQYSAGSEGWNCVETDTIVFYSQNYSYRTMTQAAGRIDRLNTPYADLWYYHLRSRSPIDLAITKALREKRNFNESTFAYSPKNSG